MAKKRAAPRTVKPHLAPLVRKIARVDALSARLRKGDDPKATAELLELSAELAQTFRAVRRNANEIDAASRRAAYAPETARDIQRTLSTASTSSQPAGAEKAAAPARLLGLSGPAPANDRQEPDGQFGLADFLKEISESVINAQQLLDLESLRNLLAPSTSIIPPNYYVIPSVKAELKVGVKIEKGKKLQLVFFSRKNDESSFSENTVSFELVATPPPPGARGPFTAPIPGFLAVDAERERVLGVAEGHLTKAAQAANRSFATLCGSHRDQAVVMRAPAGAVGASAKYIVEWPASDTQSGAVPSRTAVIGIAADDTPSLMAWPRAEPLDRWTTAEFQAYLKPYFELSLLAAGWIPAWLAGISVAAPKPA